MGLQTSAAGAAWLNEMEPGWMWRIDLDDLDVASVRRCVCAQVFGPGGFKRMQQTYGKSWAWNHGFCDTADTAVWVALVLRSRRQSGNRFRPDLGFRYDVPTAAIAVSG